MISTQKLQSAFVSAIGVSPDADFDRVVYGQTNGWDSVAHMTLVNEIESSFDIMLETNDVIDMSSFSKAKEVLGKYGVIFS